MTPIDHPVIGFRSWMPSTLIDGALCSRFINGYHWLSGKNTAVCYTNHLDENNKPVLARTGTRPTKDVPSQYCNCGLQAHHDFNDAEYYFRGSKDRHDVVYGIVKGYGHMHFHPDGWRAQYAEIKAIIPSPNMEGARKAAQYYNVPLLPTLQSVDALASEFGKKVPEHLRPRKPTEFENTLKVLAEHPRETAVAIGATILYVVSASAAVKWAVKHV